MSLITHITPCMLTAPVTGNTLYYKLCNVLLLTLLICCLLLLVKLIVNTLHCSCHWHWSSWRLSIRCSVSCVSWSRCRSYCAPVNSDFSRRLTSWISSNSFTIVTWHLLMTLLLRWQLQYWLLIIGCQRLFAFWQKFTLSSSALWSTLIHIDIVNSCWTLWTVTEWVVIAIVMTLLSFVTSVYLAWCHSDCHTCLTLCYIEMSSDSDCRMLQHDLSVVGVTSRLNGKLRPRPRNVTSCNALQTVKKLYITRM